MYWVIRAIFIRPGLAKTFIIQCISENVNKSERDVCEGIQPMRDEKEKFQWACHTIGSYTMPRPKVGSASGCRGAVCWLDRSGIEPAYALARCSLRCDGELTMHRIYCSPFLFLALVFYVSSTISYLHLRIGWYLYMHTYNSPWLRNMSRPHSFRNGILLSRIWECFLVAICICKVWGAR